MKRITYTPIIVKTLFMNIAMFVVNSICKIYEFDVSLENKIIKLQDISLRDFSGMKLLLTEVANFPVIVKANFYPDDTLNETISESETNDLTA